MTRALKRLLAASAAALAFAQPAFAQWAWRDAGGKMVYSDQPPPKSVASRDNVRQPRSAPAPGIDAPVAAPSDSGADAPRASAAATSPAKPARPSVIEREIESQRRQQQLADAEKKAADEEARRAQLAENCDRLRGYLRAIDGGFRLARVNAAGQQEILDDAARASERERARAELEQYCQ